MKVLFTNSGRLQKGENGTETENSTAEDTLSAKVFSDKIYYAFQLATAQGPLCQLSTQRDWRQRAPGGAAVADSAPVAARCSAAAAAAVTGLAVAENSPASHWIG